MNITFHDVADVLERYRDRYQWLDVFASEVRELALGAESRAEVRQLGPRRYVTKVDGRDLSFELLPSDNVARFTLGEARFEDGNPVGGGALGAAVGAGVGAALSEDRSSPEGVILGLLVGGLVDAAAGQGSDPNRILTLAFDDQRKDWRIYHGPYRRWAKEALKFAGEPSELVAEG